MIINFKKNYFIKKKSTMKYFIHFMTKPILDYWNQMVPHNTISDEENIAFDQ